MIKWNQYFKAAVGVMALGIMFSACEDFADETYDLSATDELGIMAMGDTLEVDLRLKAANILADGTGLGVILSNGGLDTVLMAVDSNTLTLGNVYAALEAAGISRISENDTAYAVTILDDSLAFRVVDIPATGTYVMYLNHHYYAKLYMAGTMEQVEIISDAMTPELIAGLYNVEGSTLLPIVKSRHEYELTAGQYLLEVSRMETTTSNTFRVVLISEQ